MAKKKKFKTGDKIVRSGQIHKIFKVRIKKNSENKKQRVLYYKHYFETDKNKKLIYSIPASNIEKANIRKLLSKDGLKRLFKKLSKKSNSEKPVNITAAKERLILNNPFKTAEILRRLWAEKEDESTSFTKSKKDTFSAAVKSLVEEVAFLYDIPLKKAKKKIKSALKE